MNIYKLKYTDRETATTDLLSKNVYVKHTFNEQEILVYGQGIHAVVEIGKICLNQPTLEIEPIFADGYHYDIMCEQEINFEDSEIIVNNPKHSFWM